MATVYAPIAKDESINTTESPSRNVADVLAQELSGIANAITGGADKVPKTDIATVEPSNTASRAYSVGELVFVNGNLYKVITAIVGGATFTVGTNIQSTNVSDAVRPHFKTWESITGFNNNNDTWTAPSDGFIKLMIGDISTTIEYIYVQDIDIHEYVCNLTLVDGAKGGWHVEIGAVQKGHTYALGTNLSGITIKYMPFDV